MCGICAIVGPNITANEIELFKRLLFLNEWRGDQSTGLVKLSKDRKVSYIKQPVASSVFLKMKEAKAFIEEPHPLFIIGHCRSATKGQITTANAHPFNFKSVIGVHNGTIHGKFENSDKYETDSEALYHNIDELGIKRGLEVSIGRTGAYALAFYDKKSKEVCFTRNDKRPLHFTFIAGGTTLLVSSTSEDLEFVIDKSTYTATGWPSMKDSDTFTLKPDTMLTVPVDKAVKSSVIQKLDLKIEERPFAYGSYEGWEEYEGYGYAGHNAYGDYEYGRHSNLGDSWVRGPDGVFRSKTDHQRYMSAHMNDQKNLQDAFDGVEIDNPSDPDGDLSEIPWLDQHKTKSKSGKIPSTKEQEAQAKAIENSYAKGKALVVVGKKSTIFTEPQSTREREVKLKRGCFCCGEVIPLDQAASVHWWDRDNYACDSCYKNEPWVRCAMTDDWTEFEAMSDKRN